MTRLLLIESPGKIKKLSQILGVGWIVKASMGHIRELANDGEDALGFDLTPDQITCRYIPRSAQAKQTLKELRAAVKTVDQVYLATDPDREGETIAWHLQQELNLKSPQRIVYTEITANAIKAALAQPRTLNHHLIAAGRARDCLDKLVGYKGSRHLVWPLNIGAKSMGRVQSAALHLLCQREQEILTFQPQDYWSVWVQYQEGFKAFYRAKPSKSSGQTLGQAAETTLDETESLIDNSIKNSIANQDRNQTGNTQTEATLESDRVTSQTQADRLVEIAKTHPHVVVKVEGKLSRQAPPPPFTTATLQQSAGSQFKWPPDHTMKIAQNLYEGGRITYMRTDSVSLATEFIQAVRTYLQQTDPTNLPAQQNRHRSQANAQEAHEAIRPTDIFQIPGQVTLRGDEAKLYDLIWRRALASCCAPAQIRKTQILTQSGDVYWQSRGQVLEFPGYSRYWHNLRADQQLPVVHPGQPLRLEQAQADQKQTQPPPRYTEPKLVQLMERKGIGRPSTYAPTVKTLKTREYVQVTAGKLQPTELGLKLDHALSQLLPDLIKPEFTAEMESVLDAIAQGRQDWERYLLDWYYRYFAPAIQWAQQQLGTLDLKAIVPPTPQTSQASQAPQASQTSQGYDFPEKRSGNQSQRRKKSEKKIGENTGEKIRETNQREIDRPCPTCGSNLSKIPSQSKKLQANHFLRCSNPECDTVMFWNKTKKQYELPYAKRSPDPNSITDISCPICGAFLEKHPYQKDGKDKIMLRCSIPEHRKTKCKDVAFFQTADGFWSPTYGVLKNSTTK